MSKDTHAVKEIRGGTVYTLCGLSFPKTNGRAARIFWGTCPRCARIKKASKK